MAIAISTAWLAACSGNSTSADASLPASDDAAAEAANTESSNDAGTTSDSEQDGAAPPGEPERKCADAGTLFACLDCCDEVHPPGQVPYLTEMDRCACTSCPTCAGSTICIEDGGTPMSDSCDECATKTRDHFGPTSCHPAAQIECNKTTGCVAAQKCIQKFKCMSKPVQ